MAPFWADVDTSGTGDVWYRESNSPALLAKANKQIMDAFPLQARFTATRLLIATWDHVGYYNRKTDKVVNRK